MRRLGLIRICEREHYGMRGESTALERAARGARSRSMRSGPLPPIARGWCIPGSELRI